MSAPDQPPFFSIVIPVKNAERTVRDCLESLQNLDYPADRFEVIMVDGKSSDRTREIAESYGVTVLIDEAETVAHGRHVGVEHSRGDFIAFSDADCVMDGGWLGGALKHFDDPTVGGVTGPTVIPPGETPFGRGAGFVFSLAVAGGASCHADSASRVKEVRDLPGANCIYRREVIEQVMPLTTRVITEDVEMNWRIRRNGWRLLRTPDVRLWHNKRPTPKRLARQMYRYGMGRCQCAKISRQMLAPAHAVAAAWIPLVLAAAAILAVYAPVALALAAGIGLAGLMGFLIAAWIRTRSLRAALGAIGALAITAVLWPLGFLRELLWPIRRLEASSLRSAGAG